MKRLLSASAMNPVCVACGLFFMAAPPTRAADGVIPTGLRCEYRINPSGIDAVQPRLSWVLESSQRGQKQTACQILVAASPKQLENDKADLWDSGKVQSDQSIQVAYAGKPLKSHIRCYWKVRAWDKDGNASAWSEPAMWSMGLLEKSDWSATWIGGVIPQDKKASNPYLPCIHLRKEFTLPKPVARATVYATAAGLYELHINGRRVGEDLFTPGWTEYDKRVYYQTYDVTDLLRQGDNVLGAILGDGWFGLHHGGRGLLALLAQLHVEFADGTTQIIPTDESWRTTFDGPILMADFYQGESYDARKEMPGWNSPGFDAASWKPAVTDLFKPVATWADVTEKVKQAVKGGSLTIAATNANFGDPIYGTPKVLRLEYSLQGKKQIKEVPENATLRISPEPGAPAAEGLVVHKAEYGADVPAPRIIEAARQAYPGVPVRRIQEIKPVTITEPKQKTYVLDMGQNFSGWVRLKVNGPAGTTVVLRFAERLNPDGTIYTTNLRAAKCTDTYVLKGNREETWEPRFTFHGFQYVEITGYPGKPSPDAVTGVVLHSNAPLTSSFDCSNPMLNQLYKNIVWGQRSNYLEVPTDCPQRDERMGWSGDAQAFIGTGVYNMDVAAFFTSWMITFHDSQDGEGGYPNIAPRHGGVSPGWGDAGVICPWTLYRTYGDRRILEKHYDGMVRWISYLEKRSKNCLRPDEGFGDWLNVKAEMPKDVIATAYFAYSTALVAKIAEVLGRPADVEKYEALLQKIKAAFTAAYVAPDGRIKGHTQTTYLMALGFDLLPADKRAAAAAHLLKLIEDRNWHLSTGFLGVNLLLPVLTEIGRLDVAYRLLQNETYPSWGYPIRYGATTIWERWDGWTQEKGFQDPGMNSFNHYAYGSAGQWMFAAMAGIDTDAPGFKHIRIQPRPGGGITYTKAYYNSIHGRIATGWELNGRGLKLSVTIPANTTATVHVPARDAAGITESGKPADKAEGVRFLRMEGPAAVFEVQSGNYRFTSHTE